MNFPDGGEQLMIDGSSEHDIFSAYCGMPNVGVALIDADGHILRTNADFLNLLGLSAAPDKLANYFDLTFPDDRAAERAVFAKIADGTEQSHILEKRMLLPRTDAAHYAGVLHVECMIIRFGESASAFFLVLMQELKVFRHFDSAGAAP